MNAAFHDPHRRDFLIIPQHERKAFSADVMRRIWECSLLKNWIFRKSGIYIRKAEDGIVHAVKFVRSWNEGILLLDVVLCVFLDKMKRIEHEATKESRVFHKQYHSLTIPVNLIDLRSLAEMSGISNGMHYEFLYRWDDISVVDRIKYELDSVAEKFFSKQNTLGKLIQVFESDAKDPSLGVLRGDHFTRATLYFVADLKEKCRRYMESWGDSSNLKAIEIELREYLLGKIAESEESSALDS